MRRALIRLSALLLVFLAAAAPASAASVRRLSGVPKTFVSAPQLRFTVAVGGSSKLKATLRSAGRTVTLAPSPSRVSGTVAIVASVPKSLRGGRYRLRVCAGSHCRTSSAIRVVAARNPPAGSVTRVEPALDSSRSSAVTIGPAGGTVSATAADGSMVSLSIPAGALAGPEEIALTPITSLGGTSLKLVAGADLEPAGLQLLAPATLTITPPHPVPNDLQAAFGYESSGTQFGLVPIARGRGVAIPVLRLGGYGLASASPLAIARAQASRPSEAEAAMLDALARPLDSMRRHAGKLPRTRLEQYLGGSFDSSVIPALRQAGVDAGAFMTAAETALAWREEADALGLHGVFASQQDAAIQSLFTHTLPPVWRSVASGCGHGEAGLQTALTLGRVAEALGVAGKLGGGGGVDAAIDRCAQFGIPVTLKSARTEWSSGDGGTLLSDIAVSFATAGSLTFQGQSPSGPDAFAYATAGLPLSEQLLSVTQSQSSAAAGCGTPTLQSFATAPSQMFGQLAGTLSLSADLFAGGPPPWALEVTAGGADAATWSMSCPSGTETFSQSPQAMAGLAALTSTQPFELNAAATTRQYQGGIDIVSGSTITGASQGHGTLAVTMP